MPIDYTKISTADLEALQAGKLDKVSTQTLEMLAGSDVQVPSTEKSFGSELLKEVPAMVGGAIGGLAKTSPARIGLSALGGAGGEAVKQIYQHVTDPRSAPQTSMEAMRRMAVAGGEMALGQGGGELLMRGIGKLIPRVKAEFLDTSLAAPEATLSPYVQPYLEKPGLVSRGMTAARGGLEKVGVLGPQATPPTALTIGQKVDPLSGAVKLESIIESSFFGGYPIKRFKWAQEKAINDMAQSVSERVWNGLSKIPPSEQGQAFVQAYTAGEDAFKQTANQLYSLVDQKIGAEAVNLSKLKAEGVRIAGKNAQFANIGGSETGDSLIKRISELPEAMTFKDASELRSRLYKEKVMAEGHDVARKMASDMMTKVDRAMEESARKLSPDLYREWREANQFYRAGKETYQNDFITRLVQKAKGPGGQPELVGKQLFQNKEVSQIRLAKNVADPVTWQKMKAGYLENALEGATTAEGTINGRTFFKSLKSMGDETLREIFSKQELFMIRQFERAARATQLDARGSGGTMLIQLMQAKPLADVATIAATVGIAGAGTYTQNPEMIAAGLSLLALPRVMGKMLVSPKYQRLFIEGLNTSRPLKMPLAGKIAAGAIEAYNESNRTEQ